MPRKGNPMDDKSLNFVNQLIEKTEQGKLSWSSGFEDGQFKTLLPGGELAFVVQRRGDLFRFRMFDERQRVILEETVTKADTEREPAHHPGLSLYQRIGRLQELARIQALQVDDQL